MKKKFDFLILGSNSFSGSNFVNYLLGKNKKVLGISRSEEINDLFLSYKNNNNINNFTFAKFDINSESESFFNFLKTIEFKFVINFVAQGMVAESWLYPEDWYKTNVLSQIRFIEFLRKNKKVKKYIHFSTPEVYGSLKGWVKENTNFKPSTPYAISRSCTDMHLLAICKNFKFPLIITRAANVFGEHQQLYRIIIRSIIFSLTKRKIYLDGGGSSKRSFIHINDVNEALSKIILKGKIGSTYHISTKTIISIKSLVTKIYQLSKLKPERYIIKKKDRVGKDMYYKLDSKKLRDLGWEDKISLHEGLTRTYIWIEKNLNKIKKLNLYYKHKK
jgi:dTDP-glucose 4,6-dehydratase